MSLKLQSAPGAEPILTAAAKAHLRVTTSDDDDYIDGLVVAARKYVESYTRRALITQTWDWFMDCGFPYDVFKVPKPPLQSITTIKYIDTDGVEQTLSSSVYTVDTNAEPGRIALAYGQSWPSVREVINNVTIRFIAGYGTAGTDVEDEILHAMKILIAHLYEHREPIIIGQAISDVPMSVQSLLWPLRVDIP